MTDEHLRPATADEVEAALAHALQHNGRKAFRISGEMMAQITAAHLMRSLEMAGYVISKRPEGANTGIIGNGRKA